MSEPVESRSSEVFLRFSHHKMMVFLFAVVILGGIGLCLVLLPTGPAWRTVSRISLIPLAIAIILIAMMTVRGRRWPSSAPEVEVVMRDEWRRMNLDRATRLALIVTLIAEYPLALLFGFGLDLAPPRPAFAMAFSTITLALTTQIGAFLYFDRD